MLIFGHKYIPSQVFYHIRSIDAIVHTPSNSTLLITFKEINLQLIEHCSKNRISFVLEVESIRDVIFAENLDAWGIVLCSQLAPSAQKIATEYMFDAKILCRVEQDEQIETMAYEGIDGVLFPEAVVKV